MKCPSCNKFCGLEMQEPEVNSIEFDASDLDNITLTDDVRIVRNSECCGDECKESSFNTDGEVSDEIVAKMKAIRATDPEAEFDAEEAGVDVIEEGGGRYAKSYYGYTLTVAIKHGAETLGTVELTDKIAASGMDELN